MFRKNPFFAIALLVVSGTIALAHGGATGIVKERMEAMSSMAKAMKSMGAIVKGAVPYDAKSIKIGAQILAGHGGVNMTKLFPKDIKQKASEARNEIWQDWDEFQRLANQLEALSHGLVAAADNGLSGGNFDLSTILPKDGSSPSKQTLASMPADVVFGLVGKSCVACHEKFRLKKH